jgi:hypothetical protein
VLLAHIFDDLLCFFEVSLGGDGFSLGGVGGGVGGIGDGGGGGGPGVSIGGLGGQILALRRMAEAACQTTAYSPLHSKVGTPGFACSTPCTQNRACSGCVCDAALQLVAL